MRLRLCVLLWAVDGHESELTDYEDRVLSLLPRYGGEVVSRVRRVGDGDGPTEVQIVHLPDEAALNSYLADPERLALADVHRRSVARTDLLTVETIV